jgi:hypothetical protein
MRAHRLLTAAIGAAALLVAATGTYAVGASHAKGFHACADSKGRLALLSHHRCAKGKHAVTIGATGATGPRGTAGKNGEKGAQGATGPLSAIVQSYSSKNVNNLSLPAGTYVINWQVLTIGTVENIGTGGYYTISYGCSPKLAPPTGSPTGGSTVRDSFALVPSVYTVSNNTSYFEWQHTFTGMWTATVPAGMTDTLSLGCEDPVATTGNGTEVAPTGFGYYPTFEAFPITKLTGTLS